MKILHLITKRDELADELIEMQRAECAIEVRDLARNDVNYGKLLEQVFDADSVQVW